MSEIGNEEGEMSGGQISEDMKGAVQTVSSLVFQSSLTSRDTRVVSNFVIMSNFDN